MKLWILYSNLYQTQATYSPQMMHEAALKQGIDAEVYFYNNFAVVQHEKLEHLFYNGNKIAEYPDVVFSRGYPMAVLNHLERNGVKVVNTAAGSERTLNKWAMQNLVQLLGISSPKTAFGKIYSFAAISNLLGAPFVMKNNFGGRGKLVFLVHTEAEFEQILAQNPDIDFLFQEFVAFSKGRDIRFYIVGNNIVGCIERTGSEGDFKSNLSTGGNAKLFEAPESLKQQALSIAKANQLEIGSVDFLFSPSGFLFCEANANAAFHGFFEQGFNMQELFMQHIYNAYHAYKNPRRILKQLESKRSSSGFEVVHGSIPVLISAPHNVAQVRQLAIKPKDLGTGHLALSLQNASNCHAIIRTFNLGKVGECNDDPNFYEQSEYRTQIAQLIKQHSIKAFIDLHSLATHRAELVNLGINGGKNIQNNEKLLQDISQTFASSNIYLHIDKPFFAGESTLSSYVANTFNIPSLQFELNSKLIQLKNPENKHEQMALLLAQIVSLLGAL